MRKRFIAIRSCKRQYSILCRDAQWVYEALIYSHLNNKTNQSLHLIYYLFLSVNFVFIYVINISFYPFTPEHECNAVAHLYRIMKLNCTYTSISWSYMWIKLLSIVWNFVNKKLLFNWSKNKSNDVAIILTLGQQKNKRMPSIFSYQHWFIDEFIPVVFLSIIYWFNFYSMDISVQKNQNSGSIQRMLWNWRFNE